VIESWDGMYWVPIKPICGKRASGGDFSRRNNLPVCLKNLVSFTVKKSSIKVVESHSRILEFNNHK
jgi:hypothetical protein